MEEDKIDVVVKIKQEHGICVYSNIDHLTCFSNTLIQDTQGNCYHFYSVDNILQTLCVWNTDHAFKIFSCLKSVFKDLQEEDDSS